MNRLIKFRIWDKYNKKMFSHEQILNLTFNLSFTDKPNIQTPLYQFLFQYQEPDAQKNYILQQFTSLKDKKGKEIYEGDIVRYWANENPEDLEWDILSVIFFSGSFVFFNKRNKRNEHIDEYIIGADKTRVDVEIIGNIFENSELVNE